MDPNEYIRKEEDHKQRKPPRTENYVGIAGPIGQSFGIVEKNWICPKCGNSNYAMSNTCHTCREKKPLGGGGLVMETAMVRDQAGEASQWREAIDPKSQLLYYFNTVTGQTSWQRPAEMGAVASGTGWYGRGEAGNPFVLAYERQNEQFLKRPARKQVETMLSSHSNREGNNDYNIWYGRWAGDNWSYGLEQGEPATTRCNVAKDAGYTRADKEARKGKECFFCIHFARGCCCKGSNCEYFHRIPLPADMAKIDLNHDCFGRERFGNHRKDMGGIGSINDDCRTLYVAGLKRHDGYDLKEAITRHFSEFGEVELVNVIFRLSIAFVRFRMRCSAEFAKVAMAGQSLDEDEVLNLRWAFADPNPTAKESIVRSNRDAVILGLMARGINLQETGFQYPANYQPQLSADTAAVNALPSTENQFDRAALQGYGVLGKKQANKKAYVEVKEYEADAYAQATDALEDEELKDVVDLEKYEKPAEESEKKESEKKESEKKETEKKPEAKEMENPAGENAAIVSSAGDEKEQS